MDQHKEEKVMTNKKFSVGDFDELGARACELLLEINDKDSITKGDLIEVYSMFICLITSVRGEILDKLEQFE